MLGTCSHGARVRDNSARQRTESAVDTRISSKLGHRSSSRTRCDVLGRRSCGTWWANWKNLAGRTDNLDVVGEVVGQDASHEIVVVAAHTLGFGSGEGDTVEGTGWEAVYAC